MNSQIILSYLLSLMHRKMWLTLEALTHLFRLTIQNNTVTQ